MGEIKVDEILMKKTLRESCEFFFTTLKGKYDSVWIEKRFRTKCS